MSRPGRRAPASRPPRSRLSLERLEDRSLPSAYTAANVTQLIADINAANASGGTNTIALTAPATSPYVLMAVNNSTYGATGLPVIAANDQLTILGNGDTIERSPATGTAPFRLLAVARGASLTLQGLTLANGHTAINNDGGGILNYGTLAVQSCWITGNTALGGFQTGGGGGIANYSGNVTVLSSTLSNNSTLVFGGGLLSQTSPLAGSVTVLDSTIAGNTATMGGGGIAILGGKVTIGCSTIAGNAVVGNYGYGGGGIFINAVGILSMTNTILADNRDVPGSVYAPDLAGRLTTSGYNLIGNTTGGWGYASTDLRNVNPALGPLQDNGGPTPTMALLPGSPALGAGNANAPNLPAYDQRGPGYARVVAGGLDIGAFEVQTR